MNSFPLFKYADFASVSYTFIRFSVNSYKLQRMLLCYIYAVLLLQGFFIIYSLLTLYYFYFKAFKRMPFLFFLNSLSIDKYCVLCYNFRVTQFHIFSTLGETISWQKMFLSFSVCSLGYWNCVTTMRDSFFQCVSRWGHTFLYTF